MLGQKYSNPQSKQIPEEVFKPKRAKEEQLSKDNLKMFHVVFVLDPPPLEYHLRTKEMYDHVIKKFSRALRWEQARSNYVSKEASAISSAGKGHHKASGEIQRLIGPGVVTHDAQLPNRWLQFINRFCCNPVLQRQSLPCSTAYQTPKLPISI